MLKILEEPTKRALLLLVCNAPGSLLPTIRSRCRRLDLSPLADAEIDALLARLRPDLEPAARRPLARLAEGSIGRALGLADEDGIELYRGMVKLIAGLPARSKGRMHCLIAWRAPMPSRPIIASARSMDGGSPAPPAPRRRGRESRRSSRARRKRHNIWWSASALNGWLRCGRRPANSLPRQTASISTASR